MNPILCERDDCCVTEKGPERYCIADRNMQDKHGNWVKYYPKDALYYCECKTCGIKWERVENFVIIKPEIEARK